MKALYRATLAASLAVATGNALAGNCVPDNPDSAYVDNGNGTVSDLRFGLMWKKCVEGASGSSCAGTASAMDWPTALAAAQSSTFAGFVDWRLPNVRELQSLVEYCNFDPAINGTFFPGTPSADVWSGSPAISPPGHQGNSSWKVIFSNGAVIASFDRTLYSYNVRLVRSGQSYGDRIFKNGFDGG